ncbi:glutamine synthetase adenylyltransferase [Paraburkholderia sp. JPY465]
MGSNTQLALVTDASSGRLLELEWEQDMKRPSGNSDPLVSTFAFFSEQGGIHGSSAFSILIG